VTEKFQKPFNKQYKEVRIASRVWIGAGIVFLLIVITQMTTNAIDPLSVVCLVFSILFLFYSSILSLLYWKCAQYQKKQQEIPKSFRIITGLLLILYLTFYQLDQKKYRSYLILKEWKFHILLWLFCGAIIVLSNLYNTIHNGKIFWMLISLLIATIVFIINLSLMISIWKYQGTNNKLFIFLTILTLNYRNYRFYKEIITLNQNKETI